MAQEIQLEGEMMFGLAADELVDYSDEVMSLVINHSRAQVTHPGHYGNATIEQRAGAHEWQVTVNFDSDESVADGLQRFLFDASLTDTAEVYFSALYQPGAVSDTNPMYTGIMTIMDIDTGTAVNARKEQSKTYPARDVEGPLTGS